MDSETCFLNVFGFMNVSLNVPSSGLVMVKMDVSL
jgi:hypothetical protein